MLDNIVTESCMAAMPIEILANAKVNKSNNNNTHYSQEKLQTTATTITIGTAAPVVIQTNKTKNILNWLKNTTSNNNNNKTTIILNKNNYNNSNHNIKTNSVNSDNNNKVYSSNQHRFDKSQLQINSSPNCTCPNTKQQNNTRSHKELTAITTAPTKLSGDKEDEFRGVQTLKNFWNKRITADRESALRVLSGKHQKFTKSVSCLVNAINSSGEPPPTTTTSPTRLTEKDLLKSRKLRALSLHDCSTDFDEISLSDIDVQKHLKRDNFYKYKTAEQASKLRELSEHSTNKKLSNGIILPAGQRTERFDWLKGHNKFARKKSVEPTFSPINQNVNKITSSLIGSDNSDKLIADTSVTKNNVIIINENKMRLQTVAAVSLPIGKDTTVVGNTNNSSEAFTPTLTSASSPQDTVSRNRATTQKDSVKTLDSASNISRDSSTTSLANSANSQKAVVKRNSSARKYSFKTHTRSYHVPRKMHANKDSVSGGTGLTTNPSNSLVAKLTQQFNEIIQKDKTLLEEIKRKNGVLMTHKGHVYKVVNTSSLNRNRSPSVSRNNSKAQDASCCQTTRSISSSTVQKNIRKFETEARGLKPKVPLKSIQVLKKSNELVKASTRLSSRTNHKKEFENKTELEIQTLPLATTLEIVPEEAKTPVENKDVNNLKSFKVKTIKEENCIKNLAEAKKEIKISEEKNSNKDENNIRKSDDTNNKCQLLTNKCMDEICRDDTFLAFYPEKIDSVIYKSIHKSKKRNKEPSINRDTPEVSKCNNQISLNNESTPTNQLKEAYNKQQIPNKNRETNIEAHCKEDDFQNTVIEISSNSETEFTKHLNKPDSIIFSAEEVKAKENVNKIIENATSPESRDDNDYDDDDKRKRKHKYAKIYEKLRFFTPFSHSNKKQKLNSDLLKIDDSIPLNVSNTDSILCENPKLLQSGEYTPMSSPTPKKAFVTDDDVYSVMCNPEAKLLDALEQVDKKLQNLSHENETILESDEYGHPLEPNSSFLHQTYAKEIVVTKSSTVIQAVNVTLVNAIEGEQMIMEQKELQKQLESEKPIQPSENEESIKQLALLLPARKMTQEEEPLYEPICVEQTNEPKTEQSSKNCEPIASSEQYTTGESCQAIEEDIYQTVEEAKADYDHYNSLKTLDIIINSIPELDGYELIEKPDDSTLSAKCDSADSSKPPVHFDGYEEYTPAVEITPTITTTIGVRKVTDELPDLPKPKRNLPKSPIPCRSAPKPPLRRMTGTEEEEKESLTTSSHKSHYNGCDEQENFYDTIKGSHCYESLQCVGNKLQISPSSLRNTNSDCTSLTSHGYESISNFRPHNTVGHHSGGSSHGSTLTISSENKTNSLYEDSLGSSLDYSNACTQLGINTSATDVNSVNGYSGSIRRTTHSSDEWTDFTDNESGDAESKPKFIIVRERSKTHKSPDWSRRVRDKRQRKSNSCIEDDDPDHYYEQLSPLGLSKRHSLLEQSRANSLQRNQEPARVSKRGKKMSYSAHALGQHISDDSFESDTDYYEESEHFKNAHNDSGVDIRTTKLPDPPASSNQMYAFVKKFKNFIVSKKSSNNSKHGGSTQKIYDNTSQFYASGQCEENREPSTITSSQQVPATKELSTSEKNLILAQSTLCKSEPLNTLTTPRNLNSNKSLRSRIRKSLVGFDNKQFSALTATRSTFYIEDPANDETNGQLDSGFSEKALSGELSTTTSKPSTELQKLSTLVRKTKKEAKLTNSQRRRTTIGIRPHEPPPPPPTDNNFKPRRQSNTSWYAECGVFKNGTTNLVQDDSQILNSQNNSSSNSFAAGSTWYEEAGLYQTSGISVASSSGSSGVSTSNEAGPTDEMSHSMFSNEPLYQIYSAAKLEAISRDMQDGSSTNGYEEIGRRSKSDSVKEETRKSSRPSALQLVEPKSGPERTLWSQIPEVINSYIIPTMTPRERALMEAKFEIITSEASYLKSLNLLRTHYMNHPVFRDQNIVSSRDRKSLFAHIVPVHECSEKLLTELESCWQDNIMLIGLSKRIYAIAEKCFNVYVGFCEHQGRMDRTLKHLRGTKGLFAQNLELLESSPASCGLNLHSFLMLPMQRITRLPLLIDAVFSKCHPNDDEYENWKMCLAIMNKIVTQCNEAANKSEQAFEIERISRQLEFNPSVIRPLAIAPAGVLAPGTKPRYLVKKGELTHLVWRGDDAKLTFGKKFSKTSIFAFLFSDLLVLTKRKAEEQFSVFDYCPRNMLTITSGDSLSQLPTKDLNSQTNKNLILMTLLENHERKTVELLLSCPSVSEQERWLQAMRPPESETPGEKLYEQWDCPQVIAKHVYENNEPDVLNLEVGDVVNVTRKLPDGWYKGERIRDGAVGWFPGSYTEEVNSVHVRARNLKQRHRLLTFTATYLESKKRNK